MTESAGSPWTAPRSVEHVRGSAGTGPAEPVDEPGPAPAADPGPEPAVDPV